MTNNNRIVSIIDDELDITQCIKTPYMAILMESQLFVLTIP